MSNSSSPNLRLLQIGQIALPVSDILRAIAFYRDTLGMRFLFQAPPGLGFFDCAGIRLMLDGTAREKAEKATGFVYPGTV
jgi:catechol 2,3-dioxygenase-like lactoylglutathione lyase family enzyme